MNSIAYEEYSFLYSAIGLSLVTQGIIGIFTSFNMVKQVLQSVSQYFMIMVVIYKYRMNINILYLSFFEIYPSTRYMNIYNIYLFNKSNINIIIIFNAIIVFIYFNIT